MNVCDDGFRACSIARREAVFEIAWDGEQAECSRAGEAESPSPAVFIAAESESGIQISEVIHQVWNGVGRVIKRRSDCQSIALGEETDESAGAGWSAIWLDEPESFPL